MRKFTIILSLLFSPLLTAETLQLESGIKRNTLIELYTSEGCSSCPPAEEYLNRYKDNASLWKTWIPVAFHVDYWDYIGWKDRYATRQYGQRQSRYAKLQKVSTVYTPAFMVNGKSWRPGFFSRKLKEEHSEIGNLVVNLDKGLIKAKFNPVKSSRKPMKLNVALLGMNLSTYIERGENTGRNAKHEFVVVGFDSKLSGDNNWQMALPRKHYHGAKKYALAVWVSALEDPTPLQAVGTYLSASK